METSHNESASNAGHISGAATLGIAPSSSSSVSTLPPGESSRDTVLISTRHDLPTRTRAETNGLGYRDSQTGNMAHRSLKKKDWDAYKDTIINEYIVRNQTLNSVIQTLKTKHGFSATPKMYKTRLSQWGIHKNTTKKLRASTETKGTTEPLDLSPLDEIQPDALPQFAQKPVYGPVVPPFQETMRLGDVEDLTPHPKDGSPPKQTNPFRPGHLIPFNIPASNNGLELAPKGAAQTTENLVPPPPSIPIFSNIDTGQAMYSPATDTQYLHARTQPETMSSSTEQHPHHTWPPSAALAISNNSHLAATQSYPNGTPFYVENLQPSMEQYLIPQMIPYDSYTHIYIPSPTTLHMSPQGHQVTRDLIYDCVEDTCSAQSRITILGNGWDNLNTFLTSARQIPCLMAKGELKLAGELMRCTAAQIEPLMRGNYDAISPWGSGPGPVAMTGMLRIFTLFHRDLPDFFQKVMLQAHQLAMVWVPSELHPTRRILAHMIEISRKPEADRLAIAEIVSEGYGWLTVKVLEIVPPREASYLTWLLLLMYPEGSDDFMAYQHGQGLKRLAAILSNRHGDSHPRTRDAVAVYHVYLFREFKVMNLKRTSPEQLAANMVTLLGFHTPGSDGAADGKVTDASTSLLTFAGPDADQEVFPNCAGHRVSAAEQTILDAVNECVKRRDIRSALGYYELLEQWHAFRQDAERESQVIMWRSQLEMHYSWSPEGA